MPRRGHSDTFTSEFGGRFSSLVREHLCLDLAAVASLIGYANSSTVQKAARGDGCLDIERLALLAKLTDRTGAEDPSIFIG